MIVYACETLGLERWEFDQSPRRRHPHTARLIVTWLWVRVFGGSQAAVARKLSTSAANVSNWYGSASRHLPDIEPLMDAVMNALPDSPKHAAWSTQPGRPQARSTTTSPSTTGVSGTIPSLRQIDD